jgi:hypothetical protein
MCNYCVDDPSHDTQREIGYRAGGFQVRGWELFVGDGTDNSS